MIAEIPMKLGELLFREGLVRQEQLDSALKEQRHDRRKIGQLLVSRGAIDEDQLTKMLAQVFQLPFIKLDDVQIDEQARRLISHEVLEAYKVLPISLKDDCLTVATHDPLDVMALQEIQYKSGYLVNPVLAGEGDIERHLREFGDSLHTVNAMRAVESRGVGGESVVRLVDSLIERAIEEKASDIHLEPQRENMRVRFRIDGVLYEKKPIPKELERNVLSRIKIMAGMDISETRRPQDGRITLPKQTNNQEYDLRLSTLPDMKGENLVLRILSKTFVNRSFESLGMDAGEAQVVERLIRRPHGIILVSGPTGAGKTTTLYSMLNVLNQVSDNIISIEDPVEYEIPGVTQTAVNPAIGYTFASAMRSILRHDPDIIMVGEIRDKETAEMAVSAALTGHLVLSTIHTNTAAGAVTRLLEMDIEPFLISSALIGVIAQRLVRRLCPRCLKEYSPSPDILTHFSELGASEEALTFAHPGGCEHCLNSGYQGRSGIFEILEVADDIRGLILRKGSENAIEQSAQANGMKNLRLSGLAKVIQKVTSLEEVMRIVALK